MAQYEVDYLNEDDQTRTKRVEAENPTLIPFALRKLDKRMKKVKRVILLEARHE